MLMAAIFAPTISASEGSVTRPMIEALVDWARRIGEHRTTTRAPVKASVFRWTINHRLQEIYCRRRNASRDARKCTTMFLPLAISVESLGHELECMTEMDKGQRRTRAVVALGMLLAC